MEYAGFALVPLIVGVVQAAKMAGLPARFAPVLSLILGVAVVTPTAGVSIDGVLLGAIVGLSAAGLYDAGKAVIKA